jgi:CheY-like chemotaxis protein
MTPFEKPLVNETGNGSEPSPHALAGKPARTVEEEVFRSDLNHKLRTPLNAIIGFAELLALKPAGTRQNDDVQQILKSAREMLAIIQRELGEAGAEGANDSTTTTTTTTTGPDLSCDVLYVEDDAVNFTLVERILEFRPAVRLLHAPRGALGLELAQALRPKMILLDLNLPDMHGSEVLRRLQQELTTAEIPVVVLSADATASQIERLLTAGAKNYLTKPFDLDPFLAVVDEFVGASASASRAA